jgi:8-oxo-dGTP diphosphatase
VSSSPQNPHKSGPAVRFPAESPRTKLGVLIGRRRVGNPSWTFPGGKIEADESPEHAAVRETFEETALRVRAIGVIGSRVHPVAGARMVYVAAVPVSADEAGIGIARGDSGELTEVRWVGAGEARALMGDMPGPVRQYLQRVLGG